MFVLPVLEAPNTKTNSLCVQTHLALGTQLFLILILNKVAECSAIHTCLSSCSEVHCKTWAAC